MPATSTMRGVSPPETKRAAIATEYAYGDRAGGGVSAAASTVLPMPPALTSGAARPWAHDQWLVDASCGNQLIGA